MKMIESIKMHNQMIHNFSLRADPEKHKKCTQSKFDIFFLHKPFSGFYKGNLRQKEEIYTDLKKLTQTWFAGLRVFPCLKGCN